MDISGFNNAINSINKFPCDINNMASILCCSDVEDMFDMIKSITQDDFSELITYPDFSNAYHLFLENVIAALRSIDDYTKMSISIRKNIKNIKELLKPYNKDLKSTKDKEYSILNHLLRKLNDIADYNDTHQVELHEDNNAKILKHIIFDYKDIDALYYFITQHGEIVNVYYKQEHLAAYVIRYYINNFNSLSDSDIDYYKRVITTLLLSNYIEISRDVVEELKNSIAFKINHVTDRNKHNLKYVTYLLNKLDNKEEKLYNFIVNPTPMDGRVDLRDLPTLTIDYFKRPNGSKVLYDDAFSIQENKDGTTYLYMHVPDVDAYIDINEELNEYMRGIGESRYARDNKLPLIPYEMAGKMSLIKNKLTAALTFRLHINQEGIIIGTEFMNTLVNINDNLSMNRAEDIIKKKAQYSDILDKMYSLVKNMVKQRKGKRDRRSKAISIMEEFNIWANIATASFFNANNIVFPYKNYISKDYYVLYQSDINKFILNEGLDKPSSDLLKEVVYVKARDYYSIINRGNSHFNGLPYGCVGNPLREYMSLETGRLIKNLIISPDGSGDYWKEKIENDCIEQTEIRAKVKELYKTTM